jgi:hypothetical protein
MMIHPSPYPTIKITILIFSELIIFRVNKNRGKFGQFLPIFKKRSFPKWENGEFLIFKTSRLNFFSTSKQNSSRHVINILEKNVLDQNSVVKDYLTTALDGNL